jgi:hypothetical protein
MAEVVLVSPPSSQPRPSPDPNTPPGNIATGKSNVSPVSLETPTLKTDVFTTGRGGSGNMAKNSDPETARRAQDVVAHPRTETGNETHVGRGGAANVFRPAEGEGRTPDAEGERRVEAEKGAAREAGTPRDTGLADRGKGWLSGVIWGKK